MKAGPVSFTMDHYIRYSNDTRDELPLYIFDKKFADKVPQLRKDYEVPTSSPPSSFLFPPPSPPPSLPPPLFSNNPLQVPNYFQEDFFSVLDKRPDFRWLVAGPSRSGSSFHVDPNSTRFVVVIVLLLCCYYVVIGGSGGFGILFTFCYIFFPLYPILCTLIIFNFSSSVHGMLSFEGRKSGSCSLLV